MSRNSDVVQVLKNELGDPVVEHAFAIDHFVFLGIERGRVVFEMLNQSPRFRALIEDLGLAFVDAPAAVHGD
jgi:hypothetical protein